MISTRAIEIVPLLEEPFDYNEYVAKCEAMDFQILPEGMYAQKLGMLMVALVKYPAPYLPHEAYLKFLEDMNGGKGQIIPLDKKTGCCGGGKTL